MCVITICVITLRNELGVYSQDEYGVDYLNACEDLQAENAYKCPWDPANVINAIAHAVTARTPRME
jgi:hypothetical protein